MKVITGKIYLLERRRGLECIFFLLKVLALLLLLYLWIDTMMTTAKYQYSLVKIVANLVGVNVIFGTVMDVLKSPEDLHMWGIKFDNEDVYDLIKMSVLKLKISTRISKMLMLMMMSLC